MTDKELEKKAFEYRKELVPYTELGYPDVEIPVYGALDIDRAYVAGAKEMQKENEQLKSQIKKMQKCLICIHFKVYNECSDNEYYACELEECNNLDKWELAE